MQDAVTLHQVYMSTNPYKKTCLEGDQPHPSEELSNKYCENSSVSKVNYCWKAVAKIAQNYVPKLFKRAFAAQRRNFTKKN